MAHGARRRELVRLLSIGAPVALTQLGMMLLGTVDTIMVGRLGTLELDGAALGNLWIYGTTVFGIGVVLGMDPLVAQAHGAGDHERTASVTQHGLVVAVLVSFVMAGLWTITGPVLRAFGQTPELSALAHDYVWLQIPSLLPFFVFTALRQALAIRGVVLPALVITLAANLFNVAGNWVLIFGHLGAPALGLSGAAIATTLTRWFLCLGQVAWIVLCDRDQRAWWPWRRDAFARAGLGRVLAVGIPVGIQYALEAWAFQLATLLAGVLGERELAAHVIVLNLASVSFMLPLGISIGAAARVGHLIGAGQPLAAQRSAELALVLGAATMGLSAVSFVVLSESLPRLYGAEPHVAMLAAGILPIAAAFQLFDGTQVVGGAVLRGMGTPRPVLVFNFVGYYVLALPLGGWLALTRDDGLVGLWWGLCAGLATVATTLVVWIRLRGPGAKRTRTHGAA